MSYSWKKEKNILNRLISLNFLITFLSCPIARSLAHSRALLKVNYVREEGRISFYDEEYLIDFGGTFDFANQTEPSLDHVEKERKIVSNRSEEPAKEIKSHRNSMAPSRFSFCSFF